MKPKLLLLMTVGMSLERWEEGGQLSRELNYYKELSKTGGFDVLIYSYGRHEHKYLAEFPEFSVLMMPDWIPKTLPFRVQNFVYNLWSLLMYGAIFRRCMLSKTNQFSTSLFGLCIKWLYGVPLLVRMGYYYSHFKRPGFLGKLEEAVVFRSCDLILVTSSEAASYIKTVYRVPEKKMLYMCNTIDLKLFRAMDIQKDIDLLFIGRLESQKNIRLLTRVLADLRLRSLIIGTGSKMSLVEDAMKRNPAIHCIGKVDNVALPEYYNRAKCFILLSEYEGNPKVLLEAMACGLPVVGLNAPGLRECIVENVNGVLVEADENHVKQQLSLLFSSQDDLVRLGAGASNWANEACDSIINIRRELSHYTRLPAIQHLITKQISAVC